MIAGGGIGDGAIDGVVNLYVIDDATREPIEGAEVQVGELLGSTDETGLFVAEGVVGPQDVVVKAPGKRKELWLGVNGANVTINLTPDNAAGAPTKTLTGAVTGFESVPFTPATNHFKAAVVTYSQSAKLGDLGNDIKTPNDANVCLSLNGTDPCNFSVVTRTGKIALIATIVDVDTKGTADGADDTITVLGFAVRQGIDTATASSGQNLTVIPAADTQTITVDFGSSPAGLTVRGAVVSIELGDEGLLPVATGFGLAGSLQLAVPKTSAVTGAAGYRLTAIATDNAPAPAQSVVLRRGLTGPTLSAGTWLAPPTGLSLTKAGGSWTNASGATVHSVELTSGSSRLLNVSVFDSSRTSFEVPALITLPSGPIDAAVNALGATDFDVQDFSLDVDIDKVDRVGGQATTIN